MHNDKTASPFDAAPVVRLTLKNLRQSAVRNTGHDTGRLRQQTESSTVPTERGHVLAPSRLAEIDQSRKEQ